MGTMTPYAEAAGRTKERFSTKVRSSSSVTAGRRAGSDSVQRLTGRGGLRGRGGSGARLAQGARRVSLRELEICFLAGK
jgi:hypothetical protein